DSVHHPPLHSFPTRRSSDLHHPFVVGGQVNEGLVELHVLLRERTDHVGMLQAGNSQDRRAVEFGIVEAVHQVNAARSRGGDAYPDRKSTRLNSSHSQISYAV